MAKILCVEDYKNQRVLYEQELNLEGYEVITAADGEDALEKVKKLLPDLIVMDINLPKMSGIESMFRIRSIHKNIPVIINTAYSNYRNMLTTLAADAYIVKSSDLTELKNKIKELLKKQIREGSK